MVGRSGLQQLIELRLGGSVCGWAAERRRVNPRIGSRQLVRELEVLTGYRVAHSTLLRWCRDLDL